MKKFLRILVIFLSIINSLCLLKQFNLQKNPLNEETVHDINVDVEGNANYKKAEFEFLQSETYHFFKYEYNTLPSSKVSIFRVDFDILINIIYLFIKYILTYSIVHINI